MGDCSVTVTQERHFLLSESEGKNRFSDLKTLTKISCKLNSVNIGKPIISHTREKSLGASKFLREPIPPLILGAQRGYTNISFSNLEPLMSVL